MDDNRKSEWLTFGTPKCGILCAVLAIVLVVLFMLLGFWKVVLFTAVAALGFFIGAVKDKKAAVKNFINRIFPPKAE